jgi:flagellar biogenesis protein FliO
VNFWANYLIALAIVAAVLSVLAYAGRRIAQAPHRSGIARIVTVVESTVLSQHAGLHVVRVGERHILIGVTASSVSTLAIIDGGSFDCAPLRLASLAQDRSAQDDRR